MKRLLILGAGTAGTMVANRLARLLDAEDWRITVVDQDEIHYYQPGFLFIPFGTYGKADVMRPKRDYLPREVEVILSEVTLIDPTAKRVTLAKDQRTLSYDCLIIATGTHIAPEQTPGLLEGEWRKSIFDFYTPDGAVALHRFLRTWTGGRLVLNVTEMPIKCPVAPLEFLFLADAFFQEHGMRDRVELVYATPLSGAFTKPIASRELHALLEEKNIQLMPEFNLAEVDPDQKVIRSYDGQSAAFDLLVSVPTNMGAAVIERSEMGDDLNFVPTEKHTLKAKQYDDIFVLGDATNLASSKAGSVAHFQVDGFVENFVRYTDGLELLPLFDGHANCFIESGHGKGFLIDFNYDVEPLPGMFPMPGLGPFSLLKQSRVNHWGKMMFRWTYWNVLLKGRELPIPAQLSLAGKQR